jgi:hypothetical protein
MIQLYRRVFELVEYDVRSLEPLPCALMIEPRFSLASCGDGLRHDRPAQHGRADGDRFTFGLDSSGTCVRMQP